METYEDIYNTICRICLLRGKTENMVSLIDNNSPDGLSSYGKAVTVFTQISIQKKDCLPKSMCVQCLLVLKQAIRFKLLCESSEKQLKSIENSVKSNLESFKEKLVEYIMFRRLFPKESTESNIKDTRSAKKKSKKMEKNLQNDSNENRDDFDIANSDYNSCDVDDEQGMKQNHSDILENMEKMVDSHTPFLSTDFIRVKRKVKRKFRQNIKGMVLKHKKRLTNKADPLVCSICDKVLANQLTYDHHMQRHNGCRYICEHCGKGFPVLAELQVHQVCRHGTGPYLQCKHCSFKAPRKFELIEHERIHTGERPFTCDKCGLTFRRRWIWKKHLIYHNEKTVQCNQCPKMFFQRSEMLAHANSVHERVYVYMCSKCGVTYAKTATVRRHMTERHGIPREMQGKVIRVNKSTGVREQKC